MMEKNMQPSALLLVSSHCPHCHALEALLRERMDNGVLGELNIIDIEQSPEVAQQLGVRSVPWLQLGDFIFDGAMTPAELDNWIERTGSADGFSSYISFLLEHGQLAKAIEWIEQGKASLTNIIPLLADPDAKMNVRVGLGAILEHFEDTPAIREISPELVVMLDDPHPAIRIDACHYLSLTHSVDAIEPLTIRLDDIDAQVREVARESIEELRDNT